MYTSNSRNISTPTARQLFTATLESIFRRTTDLENLRLEDTRANISGSHLCFAADMLICANTPHELQQILQELADESENQPKTKAMMETWTHVYAPIYVNTTLIENVESYVYLEQRYSTRDKNQDNEIQRKITAGWTAFAKHRDIFKSNI